MQKAILLLQDISIMDNTCVCNIAQQIPQNWSKIIFSFPRSPNWKQETKIMQMLTCVDTALQ